MAMKLTKEQNARKAELIKELTDAAVVVEEAVRAYNSLLIDTVELRDEIVGDLESQIDDKSERWQDSDAGQAATEFKEAWEGCDLDELNLPDTPHAETVNDLPDEA